MGQLVGFLSYIESHFNIVRKMADAKFARARSWEEMIAIHRRWMHDYNVQRVRHVGACRIPIHRKERLEQYLWVTGLTWRGNPKGTTACHESVGKEEDVYIFRDARPARYGKAEFAEL